MSCYRPAALGASEMQRRCRRLPRRLRSKKSFELSTRRRRGAEVCRQMDWIELEWQIVAGISRPSTLYARKKLGIGVAEKIDGLHGIADDEAGAAFALGPRSDEAAQATGAAGGWCLETRRRADGGCRSATAAARVAGLLSEPRAQFEPLR